MTQSATGSTGVFVSAARRTLRFEFTQSQAIGTRGPAISTDAGLSWTWLGQQAVEQNSFSCTFDADADEVRFSFGMPYQQSHWQEFIAHVNEQPPHREYLQQHVLSTSDHGRTIDYRLVGCNDGKPPEETSLAEWKSVIDTNITGTFLCCREAGKVMIPQKSGKIVNISSLSSFVVNKHFHGGAYEVSKSAINMMTKVFAVEWASHNITVNAIAPGYFGTKPNIDFFSKEEGLRDKVLDMIPMKKLGDLEELCGFLLYLATNKTGYMNGTTIPMDGGYSLW